jgi:hypothetical protein
MGIVLPFDGNTVNVPGEHHPIAGGDVDVAGPASCLLASQLWSTFDPAGPP